MWYNVVTKVELDRNTAYLNITHALRFPKIIKAILYDVMWWSDIRYHAYQCNLEDTMFNFVFTSVPTDGLALFCCLCIRGYIDDQVRVCYIFKCGTWELKLYTMFLLQYVLLWVLGIGKFGPCHLFGYSNSTKTVICVLTGFKPKSAVNCSQCV